MSNDKEKYSKINNFEARSEEVQEILSYIPSWLVRSGISVIFVIVILLLMGSYFFKYPDIIKASVEITTKNPPVVIVAKRSGKLAEIYVSDREKIKQGKLLGVIENSTSFAVVDNLREQLVEVRNQLNDPNKVAFDTSYLLVKSQNLGELQNDYSLFSRASANFINFQQNNLYPGQIEAIHGKIKVKKALFATTAEQSKIMKDIYNITRQKYQRDSLSLQKEYISKQQLELSYMELLTRKSSWKNTAINLTSIQVEITDLENMIFSLQNDLKQEERNLRRELFNSIDNLTSRIEIWKQNYVLKSPITGTVAFTKYWSENQNVKSGDRVFTVLPDEKEEIIGKIKLPLNGSGKVKEGNVVQIKLTNFPSARYGIIKTAIKSISLIPEDNFYIAEVDFPRRLISNYHKEIEFKQEMQGIAEIITEDKRLIERIIEPIMEILKNN